MKHNLNEDFTIIIFKISFSLCHLKKKKKKKFNNLE